MSGLNTPVLLAIGLALFLYGMERLESGIRALGYDAFKSWISRSTASPISSAGLGVAITALLQSSSLVSLLVLAFASASVLPLYNALGIILGANLGTTATGWLVASIGFKLSLSDMALPIMAAGGVLQLLPGPLRRVRSAGLALFGVGLVLFGLDIMKDAVAAFPQRWDPYALQGHGPFVYFLAGTLVAAVLQSSSATMMLTLAALNGGLLELQAAAAVVIGADLGTTSTTALGSLTGHHIKRQLALGHFLFNLFVDGMALILLLPLLPLLLQFIGLDDPLYSLVAFHSLFNLLGLAIFLPLLKPYAHWLRARFAPSPSAVHLSEHLVQVPDAALAASANLLAGMRCDAVVLALHQYHLRPEQLGLAPATEQQILASYNRRLSAPQRYTALKVSESELSTFSLDLEKGELSREQAFLLHGQIREARALVYSSKTQMDIRENIAAMRHTKVAQIEQLYSMQRKFVKKVYRHYLQLACHDAADEAASEEVQALLLENDQRYQQANETAREMGDALSESELSLPQVLNVNRDMHHSIKDLLNGINPERIS